MNGKTIRKTLLSLLIALILDEGTANDCVPYRVDNEIVACVCNSTYCDGLPDDIPEVPEKGSSYMFVSNKEGLRMKMTIVKFDGSDKSTLNGETVKVDSSEMRQTILGFGGAFTDATGINIAKLSQATQDQLLRAYYDPKRGSRYTLTRVPIAASEFSPRSYSYDDVANDTSLRHFALAEEDHIYKIPYLKRARELNSQTLFVAAAWSAPWWMKHLEPSTLRNTLKEDYYQTFADYLMKFLDEYKKHGLDIWAISTGNEQLTGTYNHNFPAVSMFWPPVLVTDWIAHNLGPTLAASPHNETQLLALDDFDVLLPTSVLPTLLYLGATEYVQGIAVHASMGTNKIEEELDFMHDNFPYKFLIMTEASPGQQIWNTEKLKIESWLRAERYILNIIQYMNHWGVGWIASNMVLDLSGGPNLFEDHGDAPIIVNPEADEFYKQPMYYALKHVSRFVDPGSTRISVTDTAAIKSTGFLTPSRKIVVVLYNTDNVTRSVILKDKRRGTLGLKLSPKSINTLTYN